MHLSNQQPSRGTCLETLSHLFSVVSDHVRTEELSPIRGPQWTMSREEIPGKVGKRLHRLYASEHVESVSRIALVLTLLLSLELDSLLPSMYISLAEAAGKGVGKLLVALILLSPLVLTPVYSAIGAYWTLFELAINKRLSRRTKTITLAVIGTLIVSWFVLDSPRIWDLWPSHEPLLDAARPNMVYYLIAVVLIYVPALSYAGYLLPRVSTAYAGLFASLFRWVFRFQAVERVDQLKEFLSTPLPLRMDGTEEQLLELEPLHIDALQDWAACRRRVAQDRLVPTTLILAFFGLLADTSLGDHAVGFAIEIVRNALKPALNVEWFMWYLLFLLLLMALIIPAALLVFLLTESLVMDYIAQACVLARHSRMLDGGLSIQREAIPGPQASESSQPPGCLSSLSRSVAIRIFGGKKK